MQEIQELIANALEKIKKIQNDGTYTDQCPRCGGRMDTEKIVYNSLSRYHDVYICNDCGKTEAMRDYLNIEPRPIEEWHAIRILKHIEKEFKKREKEQEQVIKIQRVDGNEEYLDETRIGEFGSLISEDKGKITYLPKNGDILFYVNDKKYKIKMKDLLENILNFHFEEEEKCSM